MVVTKIHLEPARGEALNGNRLDYNAVSGPAGDTFARPRPLQRHMDCVPSALTWQDILTVGALALGSGAWLFGAVTLSRRRHYISRARQWFRAMPTADNPDLLAAR